MDRVREKLHADAVYQSGITGRGVTVAILDTGICAHPDFDRRIVAFCDFVNGKQNMYDDAYMVRMSPVSLGETAAWDGGDIGGLHRAAAWLV